MQCVVPPLDQLYDENPVGVHNCTDVPAQVLDGPEILTLTGEKMVIDFELLPIQPKPSVTVT